METISQQFRFNPIVVKDYPARITNTDCVLFSKGTAGNLSSSGTG
jgi:hypothetical protein